MTRIKRQTLFRALIYTAGLLMLTVGVTLSTKTGLGVSPPESIPSFRHRGTFLLFDQ